MTKTIDVVAMVADNSILTFYKTDGSVYTVTQGDPRGLAMTDEFIAQRKLGKDIIQLVIGDDAPQVKHLQSEKRNPLVRFFTAPLAAVKKLFGVQSHEAGFTEENHEAAAARVREVAAKLMSDAGNGTSDLPIRVVTAETPMEEHETIIAVTQDGIVPSVENLTDQFQAGEEGKAPAEGPDNLIIRLAKISSKRGHTATELLHFLKKIDLPILADGSFLAYKRLIHRGGGVYVDPHSKRVFQRIGDVVEMDEKLVNPNRRIECSQGIHVGTRRYMGSFHASAEGSGTCLVLIQPEDVICVPQREADKMRVCRYVLLGDLSNKAHELVNKDTAMDECKDTMSLLASIAAGARPASLGTVRIGGDSGSNLTYTINGQSVKTEVTQAEALAISQGKAVAASKPVTPVRTIDTSKQGNTAGLVPEKVRTKAAVVKPADLKAKAGAAPVQSPRQKEVIRLTTVMERGASEAIRVGAARSLKDLKQQSKVSWDKLGISQKTQKEIERLTASTPQPVKTPAPVKPSPAPVKTAPKPKPAAKVEAKPEPKAEPVKAKEPIAPKPSTDTHEQAHQKRAVAEFKKGGQTKAAVANKYGTSPKSLDRWIAKYGN